METFYQIIIYFALFSVVGWALETIFCSIKDRKFVYRGFLNGPVCPIYGFGGLIVVYLLAPLQNNNFVLFLMGMVATTALEYATHFIMEKLFHAKWWDYSDLPFNINGRVCLQFSVMFGLLSVAGVHLIYPPFSKLVALIPIRFYPILGWSILGLFIADTAVTAWGLLRLNGALAEVEQSTRRVIAKLRAMDELEAPLSERIHMVRDESMSLREIKDSILANYSPEQKKQAEEITKQEEKESTPKGFSKFQINRITKAFPKMESTKYKEELGKLKEKLRDKIGK